MHSTHQPKNNQTYCSPARDLPNTRITDGHVLSLPPAGHTTHQETVIEHGGATERRYALGTDQIVLKKIFGDIRDTTDLANNEWIRHYDVKQYKDEKAHRRCLVYHEKGVRGKNRTVDTTWKNMDKVPLSVARQGPPLK